MRTIVSRLSFLGLVLVAACESRAVGPSLTAKSQPRAADRYARLQAELLTTSEPLRVQQEMSCEGARIVRAFGYNEGRLRLQGVEDSILRDSKARERQRAVSQVLAGNSFSVSGPTCDSLDAAAAREVPLLSLPASERVEAKKN
jgi:hypothetical protein